MTTIPEPVEKKSATITLRSGDNTLQLQAIRRADGRAVTFVTTVDGQKQTTRGMTQDHDDMRLARLALEDLATKASTLGWTRATGGRAFTARPDAFSKLPTPPKAKK